MMNVRAILCVCLVLLARSPSSGFTPTSARVPRTTNLLKNKNEIYNNDDNNSCGGAGRSSPSAAPSSSTNSGSTLKIPESPAKVGNPQRVLPKEYSIDSILKELTAINQEGTQNYCILGTRHCSYLHQQIIELLSYALVLSGNHVFTSGSGGTNSAVIQGALRAERPDLLTVVLPQSLSKQPTESQELLSKVTTIVEMPSNDSLRYVRTQ